MKRLFCVLLFAATVSAQAPATNDDPPPVPVEARQKIAALVADANAYTKSIAALQEKLDAVTMEYGGTIKAIQAQAPAGYELDAQRIEYVKKPPEPKPEPKPEGKKP